MANPIFFAGAKLTDFKMEIIAVVAFLLLIVLGPLLVFSPRLMRAKRTGLREYGILASRYVSEFDLKWVRGGAADDEQLIGSGDIQSLADLGNSFQVIRDIQPFPFRKRYGHPACRHYPDTGTATGVDHDPAGRADHETLRGCFLIPQIYVIKCPRLERPQAPVRANRDRRTGPTAVNSRGIRPHGSAGLSYRFLGGC